MTDISATLKERGNRYGDFDEHSRITQNLKAAMADSPNWADLPFNMKESLEMVAHKIGRILNGDPFFHDSWHDINGYVKLVADTLLTKEKTTNDATEPAPSVRVPYSGNPNQYLYLGTLSLSRGEQLAAHAAESGESVKGMGASDPMVPRGLLDVQADVCSCDPSIIEGSRFIHGFIDGTEYWFVPDREDGRVVRYHNPSPSGY